MLPCRAIADELRMAPKLLRAADTRHPPRHASIEAVFRALVAAPERRRTGGALALVRLPRRLLDRGRARGRGASLPVLGALADKSLLAKDGDRMHLHPLVQQLAALRLGERCRAGFDRGRPLGALSTLAAPARAGERERRPRGAAGDRPRLRELPARLQFSIARSQGEALKHSLPTLLNYFEHRARFAEGLALFRQALESPLGRRPPRCRPSCSARPR
jgi:hypothetical protein